MHRIFDDQKLVIATHNAGKAREISDLLAPYVAEFVTAGDLDLAEPEETETTFIGNAELKALSAARSSGFVSLADDSGLAINALGGAPGIYSARWAQKEDGSRDFDFAMDRVRSELEGTSDLSAYFVCALSLAWADGHVESFEGRVNGVIDFPARGDKGFGYDPIFVPDGYDITFAEMEPNAKHAISHRAHAFEQLVQAVFHR
ncbi:MAG: RdgB/HAM1 family non-canonical purine NTP pyrophosphatase [Bdellovibrionales bacterium]